MAVCCSAAMAAKPGTIAASASTMSTCTTSRTFPAAKSVITFRRRGVFSAATTAANTGAVSRQVCRGLTLSYIAIRMNGISCLATPRAWCCAAAKVRRECGARERTTPLGHILLSDDGGERWRISTRRLEKENPWMPWVLLHHPTRSERAVLRHGRRRARLRLRRAHHRQRRIVRDARPRRFLGAGVARHAVGVNCLGGTELGDTKRIESHRKTWNRIAAKSAKKISAGDRPVAFGRHC